jgi:glycosyltransferase involved in cell wall biosynthesis
MNNAPLVSIIVNCFNGEKYLSEAINSILSQTYNYWEVIFWDNKSTDRSSYIFKRYKNNKLRYYLSERYFSPLKQLTIILTSGALFIIIYK